MDIESEPPIDVRNILTTVRLLRVLLRNMEEQLIINGNIDEKRLDVYLAVSETILVLLQVI